GKGANGVEVDGLSSIAQRQGAKAVMATLWPVADASTALLMERFYRLRESGKLTKAEALRQAQLTLLTGNAVAGDGGAPGAAAVAVAVAGDASARGARAVGSSSAGAGTGAAAMFVTDQKAPYAHPYYWAPFVLMGNWL
ncbi:CHAT domain-containing protein, partial [Rhodoferax antarcticus]|uniref:CHAT domain-containing protein n=1 Tax=Rhodoferax antarcticus TaxID=81479 RepID=UPI0022242699